MMKRKLTSRLNNESSSNGRRKKLLVVLGLILASLAGVQIYLSGRVAVTGERINVLEAKKQTLILENAHLQDKINQVSSLAYIEQKAREELGMKSGVNGVWYLSVGEALARR